MDEWNLPPDLRRKYWFKVIKIRIICFLKVMVIIFWSILAIMFFPGAAACSFMRDVADGRERYGMILWTHMLFTVLWFLVVWAIS